jgi:hypothetical protein
MNNERLLLDSTQVKFGKRTINYLLRENNFKIIDDKDKRELIQMKSKLEQNFWQGLLVGSFTYFIFSKFLLRNNKFSSSVLFRNKILKHTIDFSSILLISHSFAYYNNYYFLSTNKAKLKKLKDKYKLLIKNSVALNESEYNSNLDANLYQSLMQKVDQNIEKNCYFVFLLFLRILL